MGMRMKATLNDRKENGRCGRHGNGHGGSGSSRKLHLAANVVHLGWYSVRLFLHLSGWQSPGSGDAWRGAKKQGVERVLV